MRHLQLVVVVAVVPVTSWTAIPQKGGALTKFPTESKELVVPSNTLEYGIYVIETVVVSSLLYY